MFNAKKREIERLAALVAVYGNALEQHHDSKGTCEEAAVAWREQISALNVRVTEQAMKLRAVGHAAFEVPGSGS